MATFFFAGAFFLVAFFLAGTFFLAAFFFFFTALLLPKSPKASLSSGIANAAAAAVAMTYFRKRRRDASLRFALIFRGLPERRMVSACMHEKGRPVAGDGLFERI